jgi:hypothetical protein
MNMYAIVVVTSKQYSTAIFVPYDSLIAYDPCMIQE